MTVRVFKKDEQGLSLWIKDHPDGFVALPIEGEGSDGFALHRSNCPHFDEVGALEVDLPSDGLNHALCSTSLGHLAQWVVENHVLDAPSFTSICEHCKPIPKTYLMVWNPKHFQWEELPAMVDQVLDGKQVPDRWSCGQTRSMQPGDRFFLIRVGEHPKGIIGSGIITTKPFSEEHWDPQLADKGKQAWYVNIAYDVLCQMPLVVWEELNVEPLHQIQQQVRVSGTSLAPNTVIELERLFAIQGIGIDQIGYPDEVPGSAQEPIYEGAMKAVKVNRYERDPRARQLCIDAYGTTCQVCTFDFGAVYGAHGEGFIHVHHLKPLNEIGETYQVDPIKDLRPVCPNCHAMLHRGEKVLSIEELKDRMPAFLL